MKKIGSKYYDRSSFALYNACSGNVERLDIVKFIVENTNKYNYDMEIKTAAAEELYDTTKYLLEQQNNQEAQIAANLDQQQMQINQMIASGDMQVQGMQEQREYQDLAGLGNAIDTARQDQNMGMNTMLNGAMSVAASTYNKKTDAKPTMANQFGNSRYNIPGSIGFTPKSNWG